MREYRSFMHPKSAVRGRGRYKSGWDSRIAVDGLIIDRISFIRLVRGFSENFVICESFT